MKVIEFVKQSGGVTDTDKANPFRTTSYKIKLFGITVLKWYSTLIYSNQPYKGSALRGYLQLLCCVSTSLFHLL